MQPNPNLGHDDWTQFDAAPLDESKRLRPEWTVDLKSKRIVRSSGVATTPRRDRAHGMPESGARAARRTAPRGDAKHH